MAAFLTVVRLDKPIESLDDLSNQFKVKYSTLNASTLATYFQRMCEIENRIYDSWMQTILDTSIRATETAKFAVWSDPVGDKYKKIWRVIQDTGMPNSIKEAVERVRKSTPDDAFAFLGDGPELRYLELMSCDLKTVGEDFAVRTKAIPLQEGSPLKEMLDDACVLNSMNNFRKTKPSVALISESSNCIIDDSWIRCRRSGGIVMNVT